MKRYLIYSLLAGMVIFYSCKKENSNTNPALQGNYKLKYFTSNTNSTITGSDGEKSVTTSDYTTINNLGTIAFDGSNLTTVGVTYTINAVAKGYIYQDNLLLDSSSFPFNFTVPPFSSVASYQLAGTDSIYFPQGALTTGLGGSGNIQYGASGGRYTLNGALLTITQTALKDSSFIASGVTFQMKESAVISIVMEKQ